MITWIKTKYNKFEILFILLNYLNNMNILKDTHANRIKVASKIEDGEIVILPSNGVYTFNTNIFNNQSIEKIYMLKERDIDTPLGVAVKDIEMAKTLMDRNSMTDQEMLIIETLIAEFWPDMLSIIVKTHLTNPLFTANGYISLQMPCYGAVKDIMNELGKPIVTTSANINKKTSCTHINHVKNYFTEIDGITALEASDTPKYGIENTIIKIDADRLFILRPGIITKCQIEEVLYKKSLHCTVEYMDECEHGVADTHYGIDKKCLLTNFVTSEMLDKSINKFSLKYLNKSIIVDFGKRNIEKKDLAAGYVDLSENGDINEGLFNLYDVLHQLNNIDKNNILFMDLYNNQNELYKTMSDKLIHCCNNKRIMVPLYYS